MSKQDLSPKPANFPPSVLNALTPAGMSLRDYFAGQALAGRMARQSSYRTWQDAAKDAYEIADAMLKERDWLK